MPKFMYCTAIDGRELLTKQFLTQLYKQISYAAIVETSQAKIIYTAVYVTNCTIINALNLVLNMPVAT